MLKKLRRTESKLCGAEFRRLLHRILTIGCLGAREARSVISYLGNFASLQFFFSDKKMIGPCIPEHCFLIGDLQRRLAVCCFYLRFQTKP